MSRGIGTTPPTSPMAGTYVPCLLLLYVVEYLDGISKDMFYEHGCNCSR